MVNPAQVAAVQFLQVPCNDLLARVYVDGRRLTAIGAQARQIKRHWEALTGARGQQLGYYFPEDNGDNGPSPDVRDAA